jgi:hypothetical protein
LFLFIAFSSDLLSRLQKMTNSFLENPFLLDFDRVFQLLLIETSLYF